MSWRQFVATFLRVVPLPILGARVSRCSLTGPINPIPMPTELSTSYIGVADHVDTVPSRSTWPVDHLGPIAEGFRGRPDVISVDVEIR